MLLLLLPMLLLLLLLLLLLAFRELRLPGRSRQRSTPITACRTHRRSPPSLWKATVLCCVCTFSPSPPATSTLSCGCCLTEHFFSSQCSLRHQ
uniref:Putative secreted peptide n=1 Tax=Anopheles braziliensis TaxID=58242 RepID=A0A2M3ZR18_9DIPT